MVSITFKGCIRIPIARVLANQRACSESFHCLPIATEFTQGIERVEVAANLLV